MTVIRIVVVLVVALAVTALAIVMSMDFGRYKGEIAAAVERATGRRLTIDGDVSLRIGFTPSIVAERAQFANAPWGSRPDMATVEQFSAEVKLLPLILGELRIDRLVLRGAQILLETDKEGRGNWMFAETAASKPAPPPGEGAAWPLPRFDRVHIERARIVWRDGKTGKADEATINALDARADSIDAPLRLHLRAVHAGVPLAADATLGPLARLAGGGDPWPFDVKVELGGATIALAGTAEKPLAGSVVVATLSVQGESLSALAPLTGAGETLPVIGPYRLAARLSEKDARWTAGNLMISVAKSSLAGEASIDTAATPPMFRATLAAPLIDFADFTGEAAKGTGAPAAGQPARPPAAGKPAGLPAAGKEPPKDGRVFSDALLPLELLTAFDAEVSLGAARLVAGGVVLHDAAMEIRLRGGTLVAAPVKATVAGAPLSGELRLTGKGKPTLAARFGAEKLDLAALLREAGSPELATGKLDIRADFKGAGTTIRALMAGLDGKAEIVMGRGTVTDKTLDFLSADVISAISPWAPKDGMLQVHCVVGRYAIAGGKLESRATLFDSDRVAITADGGVNLATERIGITVVPYAKQASLLKLAVPIRVAGTLSQPAAFPDAGRMASGAVGTVLGLPVSIAETVAGILTGGESGDRRCLAALKEAGAPASGIPPAAKGEPAGPTEGIGRAIEGIGKGIGEGLKNLFGQ